jgi:hypothetical protein
MRNVLSIGALSAAFTTAALGAGTSTANFTSPPGTTATITISLSVTTAFGTSSDSDTKTASTTATATALLTPCSPPFTNNQVDAVQISFGSLPFSFQLYCLPVIGCQTLNVTISNLVFTSTAPFSSAVDGSGNVNFLQAPFHVTGDYVASGIASGSGSIDEVGPADFTGRLTVRTPGQVKFDQLTFSIPTLVVPPDQLPAGVTALSFNIDPNFSNTTLSGPFAPTHPADLNCDGPVGPADLAQLLASWGPCANCAADFNHDGNVGPFDLAQLLSNWG